MIEIWKDIVGWEGYYQVSNKGMIKSIRRNRLLKLIKNGNPVPYFKVMLTLSDKREIHSVHRLVAVHFISNPNNLPFVNHIDRNSLNNDVPNLEWTSVRENTTHGYANKKISKHPGVTFSKRKGRKKRWVAKIWHEGKLKSLGIYLTEDEAGAAYRKAMIVLGIENKYVSKAA